MKNEQEIVRSVFDAYIRDAKASSTKKNRPTFDMLEEVKNRAIKALEQPTFDDVMAIHTQVLAEGIRCAMCTNSMKNDRGCDGGCVVDENMYKKVMETINNQMFSQPTSNDCVSRQAVVEYIKSSGAELGHDCENEAVIEDILALPPVTPTIPYSEDCVSRQAVLDKKVLIELPDGQSFHCIGPEDVENLPPVTPTQSWIPVSERLPEDRNIVLVTAYWHETYQVMMASYFGEGLWWCVPFNNCGDHMQKLNPKAWQSLPKPYEEKRGNLDGSN